MDEHAYLENEHHDEQEQIQHFEQDRQAVKENYDRQIERHRTVTLSSFI